MADKVVKLSQSYESHGKSFDTIELRAPKLKDLIAGGGEVWETQRVGAANVVITHYDRLDFYIGRLVQEPAAEALSELNLTDAMLLERAIAGFFTEATLAVSKLVKSSGAAAKESATSAT